MKPTVHSAPLATDLVGRFAPEDPPDPVLQPIKRMIPILDRFKESIEELLEKRFPVVLLFI